MNFGCLEDAAAKIAYSVIVLHKTLEASVFGFALLYQRYAWQPAERYRPLAAFTLFLEGRMVELNIGCGWDTMKTVVEHVCCYLSGGTFPREYAFSDAYAA